MMNKQERQTLAEILFGLAGNFGDTVDNNTVKIWARGFESEGITLDQIRQAALKILKTRTISKMPTFAEFLQAINGSPADKAQQQADIVIEFLRRNGRMVAKPDFEDPVTAHLMKTRWPYQQWAATVEENKLVWWRKEFVEAYQSYAKNPGTIPNHQLEAGDKVRRLAAGIGGE